MKILGILLLIVVGAICFVNWRDANIKRQEADRARAEAMVAEMQAAGAAKAAAATPAPGRTMTWDLATGRYVEHAANVSVMQSHGGGSGGTKSTPRAISWR